MCAYTTHSAIHLLVKVDSKVSKARVQIKGKNEKILKILKKFFGSSKSHNNKIKRAF